MESVILRKLKIVQDAKGDIAEVERQLDEGQIEEAIDIAKETALPSIRIWIAGAGSLRRHLHGSWSMYTASGSSASPSSPTNIGVLLCFRSCTQIACSLNNTMGAAT